MVPLPADATKTALAEAAALRAIVFARKNNGGVVNRLAVEEAMQAVFFSVRYADVPHPALRTVFAQVRRQARYSDDITVRLDVNDSENRIGS